MIGRILVIGVVAAACWLAWQAWLPEPPLENPVAVEVYVPPPEHDDGSRWRVVTHRMVWKQAVQDLQRRLTRYGLHATLLKRHEDVPLFVFDDSRRFTTMADASRACLDWQKHHIECDPQKRDEHDYILAIGRYYIPEFARKHEQALQASKLPYTLDMRTIRIPTMRFAFPVMNRKQADELWQQLRNLGVTQPVMMQQQAFEEMYGKSKKSKKSKK